MSRVQDDRNFTGDRGELATSMTAFMATAMWHLGQVTLLDDAGLKGLTVNPNGPTRYSPERVEI